MLPLQAQKSAQGAGDVVALGVGGPHVRFPNAAALLQAAVVVLGAPGQRGQRRPLLFAQVCLAAGPVLGTARAAVWDRQPEDADRAVAPEPNG